MKNTKLFAEYHFNYLISLQLLCDSYLDLVVKYYDSEIQSFNMLISRTEQFLSKNSDNPVVKRLNTLGIKSPIEKSIILEWLYDLQNFDYAVLYEYDTVVRTDDYSHTELLIAESAVNNLLLRKLIKKSVDKDTDITYLYLSETCIMNLLKGFAVYLPNVKGPIWLS